MNNTNLSVSSSLSFGEGWGEVCITLTGKGLLTCAWLLLHQFSNIYCATFVSSLSTLTIPYHMSNFLREIITRVTHLLKTNYTNYTNYTDWSKSSSLSFGEGWGEVFLTSPIFIYILRHIHLILVCTNNSTLYE